jgi:hypothetical protein
MEWRSAARRRSNGLIVSVLGLWGMFVFCTGLGFVASFTSEDSSWSAEVSNVELRSAATEGTVVATVGAAALLALVAVSRWRSRGRGACSGSRAERSTPCGDS